MKTVHWQLPFSDNNFEQYRIDIYAEGECETPKQLIGASTPFSSSEDAIDEAYAGIRGQNATIMIANEEGLLTVAEFLPKNDTDKSVRLIRVSDNKVMWQGFLSSATYSQSYTSRTAEIELACNSVIMSMQSEEVRIDYVNTLLLVKLIIAHSIEKMNELFGETIYSRVYYPRESWRLLQQALDVSVFASIKEKVDEETITYMATSESIYDVMQKICEIVGWVCMEQGDELYFELVKADGDMLYEPWEMFRQYISTWPHTQAPEVSMHMSELEYMGTGHQLSITPGAKSVQVTASMEKTEIGIQIPDMPVGNVDTVYHRTYFGDRSGKDRYEYTYIVSNLNKDAYSNLRLGYYKTPVTMDLTQPTFTYGEFEQTSVWDMLNGTYVIQLRGGDAYRMIAQRGYPYDYHVGAFLARVAMEEYIDNDQPAPVRNHDWKNGLYCMMIPADIEPTDANSIPPIATFDNVIPVATAKGYLIMNFDYRYLAWDQGFMTHQFEPTQTNKFYFRLKFAGMYWNGTSWQEEMCHFAVETDGNGKPVNNWSDENYGIEKTDGYIIPIDEYMSGYMQLELLPFTDALQTGWVFEAFFSSLSFDWKQYDDKSRNDRKENSYYRETGESFKEEAEKNVSVVSSLNNMHSASMLMVDSSEELTKLRYHKKVQGGEIVQVEVRPELDLVNRLKTYYSLPRSIVSLEVKSTDTPLPRIRIKGYDGKTYLPLSENRDWRTGVSTIQCWEMPE